MIRTISLRPETRGAPQLLAGFLLARDRHGGVPGHIREQQRALGLAIKAAQEQPGQLPGRHLRTERVRPLVFP